MRAFIWAMLILMAFECVGKAVIIWKQDFQRSPAAMVADIAFAICFIAWAAWLLGNGAAR